MNTPVFLLHGLGCRTITLWPLEQYLRRVHGLTNTYRIAYPIQTLSFEDSLDFVDRRLGRYANKQNEIILIGQSMGGVVANSLHKKGWKIKLGIYIGSPLHGAHLISQLESILPTTIQNLLYIKPFDYLKSKDKEKEPPHNYHTISMAWPFTDFDGCVYRGETMMDERKHTHIPWSDHCTIFANPRLWTTVGSLLVEKCI